MRIGRLGKIGPRSPVRWGERQPRDKGEVMTLKIKGRNEGGEEVEVEGHVVKIKFYDQDGGEVEAHTVKLKGRDEGDDSDADVEAHGPMFRLSTSEPEV